MFNITKKGTVSVLENCSLNRFCKRSNEAKFRILFADKDCSLPVGGGCSRPHIEKVEGLARWSRKAIEQNSVVPVRKDYWEIGRAPLTKH